MSERDDTEIDMTDEENVDAERVDEMRDLMEGVGGDADESDDALPDAFGSQSVSGGIGGSGVSEAQLRRAAEREASDETSGDRIP